MTKPLASISTATTFRLRIVGGTPHFFRDGELTTVLESSGRLTLEQNKAGKLSHYAKTATPSRVAEVRNLLANLDFARMSPYTGALEPGDYGLKVSVVIDGQQVLDTQFFMSDDKNLSSYAVLMKIEGLLVDDAWEGAVH